jgi:hypothetical protein
LIDFGALYNEKTKKVQRKTDPTPPREEEYPNLYYLKYKLADALNPIWVSQLGKTVHPYLES